MCRMIFSFSESEEINGPQKRMGLRQLNPFSFSYFLCSFRARSANLLGTPLSGILLCHAQPLPCSAKGAWHAALAPASGSRLKGSSELTDWALFVFKWDHLPDKRENIPRRMKKIFHLSHWRFLGTDTKDFIRIFITAKCDKHCSW